MKIVLIIIIAFISLSHWSTSLSSNSKKAGVDDHVKKYLFEEVDLLKDQLTALEENIINKGTLLTLKNNFTHCRFVYKKIEPVVEYFFQGLHKRINGPALPDVKTEDNQVWPPHGFQVIEQLLYDNYDTSKNTMLLTELNILKSDISYVSTNMNVMSITPMYFAELLQHQVIRIGTMGITGFDAPLSKLSLPETIQALKGIQELIALNRKNVPDSFFENSIKYIELNNDFDTFDRLHFMKHYLMPLSDAIETVYKNDLKTNTIPRPFTGSFSSLLKGKSFNADYFTNYAASQTNGHKVDLGKKLFYDTRLSKLNNISCGSCHKPELYFTDGLTKAKNFIHGGTLARNTPSILYASLQNNQFYDMRTAYLEEQINEVIKNSKEFNSSSKGITKRLLKDKEYKKLFVAAFSKTDSITSFELRNAIATYIRSINTFSSAFDEYMNGNELAMTVSAKQGFNLFAGKAKCATCHFIPLFNGTIPPFYNKTESEIIGVPKSIVWKNAIIDEDVGRYSFNQLEELKFAFKTPTLRNVAQTAPYMHNGVYKNLEEVVEFYHKGGGVGIGIKLPFQSLPFDSLQLSIKEKNSMVSFMEALTDKSLLFNVK
jgi:cytochrome c peroxidase